MRIILFLLLIASGFICHASDADTIPQINNSKFLVFPFFLRSPETSWGFGAASAYFFKAKKNDENIRTSDINLVSLYTLNEQLLFVLGSTVFFPGEKRIFRFQSSFSYYPDQFWGLGNNSDNSIKESYSLKQVFLNAQLLQKYYRKFYVGLTYELQGVNDVKYDSGGVFVEQNITGKDGGFTSGVGLLITYDSRNNAYSPNKGVFAEINATRFGNYVGSDFDFTCYTLDARKFFCVTKNTTIGVQTFNRFTHGEIPFRYLSNLGGPEVMRGYYKGRYADNNLVSLQAEVRQFLFWRLGVVGFAGAGQVSHAVKNFEIDQFHYSVGGGLRILVQKKEQLNLRVDFGFGEKSSGVYVILKEAF